MIKTPYTPSPKAIFSDGFSFLTDVYYEKNFQHVDDPDHDPEHIHDFYEIYVHLGGDVAFLVDDTVYPVSYGDVVLTKPNEIHKCIYLNDGIHEHFCIWMNELPLVSDAFEKHSLLVFSQDNKKKFIELCFDLLASFNKTEELKFRALSSFFGILDAICTDGREMGEPQSLPTKFIEIVEYISAHFCDPSCTVNNICDVFYISKSTLCRQFKQHFQTTPSDYIDSKRFSEAKKLLLAGQSVQQTCYSCGFSDCSYFIMRFHKKFGMTPYKYQHSIK